MERLGRGVGAVSVGLLIALSSCADPWFGITDASASSAASSILHVGVDGCAPAGQPPTVVETGNEVRLTVLQRHGGDELMCLSGFEIQLAAPIGNRKVIDARHDREVAVTLALPFTMPAPTWLPAGWKLQEESAGAVGVTASYGRDSNGSSVTVSLTPTPEPLEQFRGAAVEATTTIQGRAAVWTHATDQPDVKALVLQG